jgi:hypothetical protein
MGNGALAIGPKLPRPSSTLPRADTLTEYHSHPLLFTIEGIEFDLRYGEIRIPQATAAPLVILGPHLCLQPIDVAQPSSAAEVVATATPGVSEDSASDAEKERVRAEYDSMVAAGQIPGYDKRLGNGKDLPRAQRRKLRAQNPDPRLH